MKTYTQDLTVKRIAFAAFPSYAGRSFAVAPFEGTKRLDSCWSGGSRDYYQLVSVESLKTIPIPENGTPFSNGGQILTISELPQGAALVQHTIFSGKDLGITVYVRPENLAPLLPAPLDLSWGEKVVLTVTGALKGFARLKEAQEETGITVQEYDAAKLSLAEKGLLTRARAITDNGRNATNAFPGFGYSYKLSFLNKKENGGKGINRWGMNP